jgi:hypothetical protein
MTRTPDFLADLAAESQRFAEVMGGVDPAAPVPSFTEVQLFWETVVRERLLDPDAADVEAPQHPAQYATLRDLFDKAWPALHSTLSQTEPGTRVWTWSDDWSVAFVRRRQAHEALIHRVDAELTAGGSAADAAAEVDPLLAADGVDEALRCMLGGCPSWAELTPTGGRVLITAADTSDAWLVRPAVLNGTSPSSGTVYVNEPTLAVEPSATDADADTRVTASAGELDLWLWGRAPEAIVHTEGDPAGLHVLRALIAAGVR